MVMVWDLRGALLKKEEKESARLMDFTFRHRARTFRLLAERVGADVEQMVRMTTRADDAAILEKLRAAYPGVPVDALHAEARAEARAALIGELGDPTPYRLL